MAEPEHTILRVGRGKAFAVSGLPSGELRRLLDDPAALLWENLHRPVKMGHGSLMVEAVLPLWPQQARVAYKRYRARNWWKSLCGMLRRGRAENAWELGHRLIARGIATARPLAMCETRESWFVRRSYLATEWVEQSENLHLYGWRLVSLPIQQRLRLAGRCAESLGRLVGRLHAQKIAHRDLKGANVLVAPRGDRLSTCLVDVDGVRFCRRLRPARRAADLARLAAGMAAHPWITRTVCRRFLRAYIGEFPAGTIAWKELWREVAARSRRIVQRKRRAAQQVL